MQGKARFLGHPIHQMLVVFPLGLLVTSVLLDVARIATGNPMASTVAYWVLGAGLIGALVAAPFGTIDWLSLPVNTRARRIGAWHGAGNLLLTVLFLVSWMLRRDDPAAPPTLAITLSCVGLVLGLFTGWLGGELVTRLGVGVHDDAHLDAPNSLLARRAGAQTAHDTRTPRAPQTTTPPSGGVLHENSSGGADGARTRDPRRDRPVF